MTPSRSMSVPLVVLLLAAGCVSKKAHQATTDQLAECTDETAALEAQVARWQDRFDRESNRWETMQASITEAVPNALAEFDAERDRILELVPEQVQFEVSSYLDDYFSTVMKGFELMRQDTRDVQIQLEATRQALEVVGADTKAIGVVIDRAVGEERDRRAEVASGLSALIDQVVGFDRDRIHCKSCPDRVKLNRKEREAVLGFHAELLEALSDLQRTAAANTGDQAGGEPAADVQTGGEPAADDAATDG